MNQVSMSLPRDHTFRSDYAKLLNRLVELQTLPSFALYVNTLADAEMTIIALENRLRQLMKETYGQ